MAKIPFKYLPGSWGLKGKAFEKAKAEYELEGLDLEQKLIEIEFGEESHQAKRHKIKMAFSRKQIEEYDFDIQNIELDILDPKEKAMALLVNEHKHHKINDVDFEKAQATLKGEPWVKVLNISMDPKNPSTLGEAELDWNEIFIEKLKEAGHTGPTDYVIVDNWFTMFCAAVANDTGLVDKTDHLTEGLDSLLPPSHREYR